MLKTCSYDSENESEPNSPGLTSSKAGSKAGSAISKSAKTMLGFSPISHDKL
jgi:hypothetical protein